MLRERHQRRLLQETKDQSTTLRKSWDLEKSSLQQRLDQQERLLNSFSMEKKGTLPDSKLASSANRYFQSALLWQVDVSKKNEVSLVSVSRSLGEYSCFFLCIPPY